MCDKNVEKEWSGSDSIHEIYYSTLMLILRHPFRHNFILSLYEETHWLYPKGDYLLT